VFSRVFDTPRFTPLGRQHARAGSILGPMPKVKVESQSKHSAEETFKKIRNMLENDRELRKMDSSYVCQFNEKAGTGTAKGGRFEADMRVTAKGSGASVEIEVSLPLMLTPVKGIVQSTLQKKLESALA
jgi:hypothetical protein